MKNKKALAINETLELILAAAGIALLLILFFKLTAPTFDKDKESAVVIMEQIQAGIDKFDKSGDSQGKVTVFAGSNQWYLTQTALSICICNGDKCKDKTKYCKSSKTPVVIVGSIHDAVTNDFSSGTISLSLSQDLILSKASDSKKISISLDSSTIQGTGTGTGMNGASGSTQAGVLLSDFLSLKTFELNGGRATNLEVNPFIQSPSLPLDKQIRNEMSTEDYLKSIFDNCKMTSDYVKSNFESLKSKVKAFEDNFQNKVNNGDRILVVVNPPIQSLITETGMGMSGGLYLSDPGQGKYAAWANNYKKADKVICTGSISVRAYYYTLDQTYSKDVSDGGDKESRVNELLSLDVVKNKQNQALDIKQQIDASKEDSLGKFAEYVKTRFNDCKYKSDFDANYESDFSQMDKDFYLLLDWYMPGGGGSGYQQYFQDQNKKERSPKLNYFNSGMPLIYFYLENPNAKLSSKWPSGLQTIRFKEIPKLPYMKVVKYPVCTGDFDLYLEYYQR